MAEKKKTTIKKATKTHSRRQKPKVVAIVACDSIIQQLPSGKPTLVGIFDRINVTDPSKGFRPFSLMTKLFGGRGKYRVGLRIKTPASVTESKDATQDVDFSADDIFQGTITVSGLDVSKPGIVTIHVTLDGEPEGNPCPIRIIHIQSEHADDNT